jgi:predicted phosphodiesterase
MSDEMFTKRMNQKLKKHLKKVERQVSTIICAIHLVPFAELLRTIYTSKDKFLNGFSGNRETGRIIQSFPKGKYVFCGHTHERKESTINGIKCINTGSDYLRKRSEIIQL